MDSHQGQAKSRCGPGDVWGCSDFAETLRQHLAPILPAGVLPRGGGINAPRSTTPKAIIGIRCYTHRLALCSLACRLPEFSVLSWRQGNTMQCEESAHWHGTNAAVADGLPSSTRRWQEVARALAVRFWALGMASLAHYAAYL